MKRDIRSNFYYEPILKYLGNELRLYVPFDISGRGLLEKSTIKSNIKIQVPSSNIYIEEGCENISIGPNCKNIYISSGCKNINIEEGN